jgi:hypothetical protein
MKRLRLRPVASPHGTNSTRRVPTSAVSAVVVVCLAPISCILASAVAPAAARFHAADRFAIKSAISELVPPHVRWAERVLQFKKEFRQFGIAPTPQLAEQASTDLSRAPRTHPQRFAVGHPGSGKFFEQNGLPFLTPHQLARFTNGARRADALVAGLVEDPSRRAILAGMSTDQDQVKALPAAAVLFQPALMGPVRTPKC